MESCCIDKLQARVENFSAKEKEKKKEMKTEGKPSVSMAQVLLHRLQSLAMKQNTLYSGCKSLDCLRDCLRISEVSSS